MLSDDASDSPETYFFLFSYCFFSSENFPFLAFKVITTSASVLWNGSFKEILATSLKITGGTFLSFLK